MPPKPPSPAEGETLGGGDARTLRVFVAVEPAPESADALAALSARLRDAPGAPTASWTSASKLHLTIKFVGHAVPAQAAALAAPLPDLARRSLPGSDTVRAHAFPSRRDARIVIAAIDDPDGSIAAIARAIDDAAASAGVVRETRAFRPHVTLARLRAPVDVRRWLPPDPVACACRWSHLTLFESRLGRGGSTYVPLVRCALGADHFPASGTVE